jgi:hypothetical protein
MRLTFYVYSRVLIRRGRHQGGDLHSTDAITDLEQASQRDDMHSGGQP